MRAASRQGYGSDQQRSLAALAPAGGASFERRLVYVMGRDAEIDRYVLRDGRKIKTRSYVIDEHQVMRVSHWRDCGRAGSLDETGRSCTLVVVTFPY